MIRFLWILSWSLFSVLPLTLASQPEPTYESLQLGRGTANALDWRPDGKVLAIGSGTGIWLFDDNFQLIARLGDDVVQVVSWNSDGSLLATVSQDLDECWLRVWEVSEDAKSLKRIWEQKACELDLTWGTTGNWLTLFDGNRDLHLVNLDDSDTWFTIPGEIKNYTWSPDGARIAIALADNQVRVLDVYQRKYTLNLSDAGYAAAWSPDGKQLATVTQSGTKKIERPMGEACCVSIDWSAYHGIKFWDTKTGEYLKDIEITDDSTTLTSLYWIPGNIVGGDCTHFEDFLSGLVCLWDLDSGESYSYYIAGGSSGESDVDWSPDYSQFSVEVYWRISYTKVFETLSQDDSKYSSGVISTWHPDNRHLTSIDLAGKIVHYDTGTDKSTEYPLLDNIPFQLVWSPDGNRIAYLTHGADGWDTSVHIQDVDRQLEISAFQAGITRDLKWSSDGQTILTSVDSLPFEAVPYRSTYAWDFLTGNTIMTHHTPTDLLVLEGATRVYWNEDQSRAALTKDNGQVWFTTGQGFISDVDSIHQVVWSPDQTILSVVGTSEQHTIIENWDILHLRLLGRVEYPSQVELDWSPDSQLLEVVSYLWGEYLIEVWDSKLRHNVIRIVVDGSSWRYSLPSSWSPESSRLAVPTSPFKVEVFDLLRGRSQVSFPAYQPTSLAWSPDDKHLAIASYNGTISIWDVPS